MVVPNVVMLHKSYSVASGADDKGVPIAVMGLLACLAKSGWDRRCEKWLCEVVS